MVTLSDKQREMARNFQKEHYENCETGRASFKYIITPTGIGNVVEIKCPKCGEILDLTDYDMW